MILDGPDLNSLFAGYMPEAQSQRKKRPNQKVFIGHLGGQHSKALL